HAQGRASGLRHLTRETSLPLTPDSSCPVRADEIRSVSQSGSHAQSVPRPALPGGGRDPLAQLIRASPPATAPFITRHDRAPARVPYRAANYGQSRSVAVSRQPMRVGTADRCALAQLAGRPV